MPFAGGSGLRKAVVSSALFAASLVLHLATAFSAESVSATQSHSPQPDPTAAIIVGPRAAVGTDTVGEKTAEGIVGGVLGSVFGRRDSGPRSDRPDTHRDPTRKLDYVKTKALDGGLEIAARVQWRDDGLLVSVRIDDAPGKGTFQSVFLQSCSNAELYPGRDLSGGTLHAEDPQVHDPQQLYPGHYEIYDLWDEGSFSVGWSRGSMRDGQVIDQDSGGISGTFDDGVDHDERSSGPGVWRQLGFDRAHHGARQIGAWFDLSPAELAQLGEAHVIVHTTLPSQDPVTTAASYWSIAPGADGEITLQVPEQQPQGWWGHCNSAPQALLIAAAGPAGLRTENFWGLLQLVGVEAKILNASRSMPDRERGRADDESRD